MKRSFNIPAHRMGKCEMVRRIAEKALDEGKTICFATPDGKGGVNYETRGAGVARDVTPTTKLIEKK